MLKKEAFFAQKFCKGGISIYETTVRDVLSLVCSLGVMFIHTLLFIVVLLVLASWLMAVTHSSLEREVKTSNLGSVKSVTVLPTAGHRFYVSSKKAVLTGCNDEELGPANSLHVSA